MATTATRLGKLDRAALASSTALAGSTVRTRRPSASAVVRREAASASSRPAVWAARTSPHRLAQAQQGGVLRVAQPGLGGQQSRRAEPGGCLLPGAELVRAGGGAQRIGECLDHL